MVVVDGAVDGVVAVVPVTAMAFVPVAALVLVVMFPGLWFGVVDPRWPGVMRRRIGSLGLKPRS